MIERYIKEKGIIICGGSGGVGKTTIAAAIALHAAMVDRNVLVLTIDPAKRLANSLGIASLGNEEIPIPPEKIEDLGIKMKGRLFAMMLDSKRTIDSLIERYAPNKAIIESIFKNRFYQNISTALAGTDEYSAMERLYELKLKDKYDLIVLDTPPTKHALDFLDAPSRVVEFFGSGITRWFLRPYIKVGKAGIKTFQKGTETLFNVAQKLTGFSAVKDLLDLAVIFEGMFDGFEQRASKVQGILRDSDTTFILVTSPVINTIEETILFYKKLKELNIPFGGFIINRVHENMIVGRDIDKRLDEVRCHLSAKLQDVFARLVKLSYDFQVLADIDRQNISRLIELDPDIEVVKVPYFDTDIFDISGLLRINKYLSSQ